MTEQNVYTRKLCYMLLIISCLLFTKTAHCQEVRDSVKIYFRQGSSVLDLSIGNNQSELNRIAEKLSACYADSLCQFDNILVVGGASPEGGIQLNKRLSERRANALFDYLSHCGSLSAGATNFVSLNRDWQGLLDLVKADDKVPYRDEVIALIEDIIIKQGDETQISQDGYSRLVNLRKGEPHRYLYRELFPELRASYLILSYNKIVRCEEYKPIAYELKMPALKCELPEFPSIHTPVEIPPYSFYMGVKSNLLGDILLLPNIGVEFYLGGNVSVAANWTYAWWKSDRQKWYCRNYGGDIALRKWLGQKAKEKPLTGHHIGPYAQVFTYDFLVGKMGYMAGEPGGDIFNRANFTAGLEYGYSLPIARRLNIDFSLCVGYMWGKYYEYTPIDDCYVWQATKKHRYFGPTKAEISLVWLIGQNNVNIRKGGK